MTPSTNSLFVIPPRPYFEESREAVRLSSGCYSSTPLLIPKALCLILVPDLGGRPRVQIAAQKNHPHSLVHVVRVPGVKRRVVDLSWPPCREVYILHRYNASSCWEGAEGANSPFVTKLAARFDAGAQNYDRIRRIHLLHDVNGGRVSLREFSVSPPGSVHPAFDAKRASPVVRVQRMLVTTTCSPS